MIPAPIVHPELAKASFGLAVEPLLAHGEHFVKEGLRVVGYSFPYLDLEMHWATQNRWLTLRVDGTNFPYRPADAWWIDSAGYRQAIGIPHGGGFHILGADNTPRAWFCWLGWAGYHDHPSHQDTAWAAIREHKDYRLVPLLQRLVRHLNEPGVQVA